MDVNDKYFIYDIREPTYFKNITICGYSKKKVLMSYQSALINGKLEEGIRLLVELHTTGFNNNIFDILYNVIIIYIHNPKIYLYYHKRIKEYNDILQDYPKKHELLTRNNQEIRNLLCELTAIVILSPKNQSFTRAQLPKVSTNLNDINELRSKITSNTNEPDKKLKYIHINKYISIYSLDLSDELTLGLNEIIYILHTHGSLSILLYWYIRIEKACYDEIINYNTSNVNLLHILQLTENEQNYWIWLLWKILFDYSDTINPKNKQLIQRIFNDYTHNFKQSTIKKKKYLIFMVIYIIYNRINWNTPIYTNEPYILQSIANINVMYLDIKNIIENNITDTDKQNILYYYNQLLNNNISIVCDTSINKDILQTLHNEIHTQQTQPSQKNIYSSEQYKDECVSKAIIKNINSNNNGNNGNNNNGNNSNNISDKKNKQTIKQQIKQNKENEEQEEINKYLSKTKCLFDIIPARIEMKKSPVNYEPEYKDINIT